MPVKKPNRLINEKSPYLRQHAYNPVDWYPWCDEATLHAIGVTLWRRRASRMTGYGGWPLTVFMTPDKVPFFAGTYFPKEGFYGRPGLTSGVRIGGNSWNRPRKFSKS